MRTSICESGVKIGIVGLALWVLGTIAACDRLSGGGIRHEVGHGIVVWHLPGERGGFPSDRFRVSTPAGDGAAPYVVLENMGPGRTTETLLEAPLPAAARDTPLRVRFERVRVALEVGPARTSRDVALPLWPGRMVITSGVQDTDSAIVLHYSLPPELDQRAEREGVSFEEARRSPASRYLRLRFEMRPRS
jgi:hypothetical protein